MGFGFSFQAWDGAPGGINTASQKHRSGSTLFTLCTIPLSLPASGRRIAGGGGGVKGQGCAWGWYFSFWLNWAWVSLDDSNDSSFRTGSHDGKDIASFKYVKGVEEGGLIRQIWRKNKAKLSLFEPCLLQAVWWAGLLEPRCTHGVGCLWLSPGPGCPRGKKVGRLHR